MPDLLHQTTLLLSAGLGAYSAHRELRASVAAASLCFAVVAASTLFLTARTGADWPMACTIAVLFLICCLIAEIDRRQHLIPDMLVLAVVSLAVGAPAFDIIAGIVGAAATGLIFLLVRWLFLRAGVDDALGLGDVKLAVAIGLFLGPTPALIAVAVAAGATAAVLGTRIALTRAPVTPSGAPFGVGLAAALFAAALHQAMAP